MYTDKRPLPYSLPVGMALVAGRAHRSRLCAQLLAAARRRRADRLRLGDLPSGILARRAARLGRPLRPRAVDLPGRRQCRPGDRAAARRLHRRALRPGERRLVRAGRAGRHRRAVAGRRAGTRRICVTQRPGGQPSAAVLRSAAGASAGRAHHPGAPDLRRRTSTSPACRATTPSTPSRSSACRCRTRSCMLFRVPRRLGGSASCSAACSATASGRRP